ncbi:inner centromere protein B-like [Mya arenaria]|uniref:inner centromere protein B-like n=1 Tax=Mya arenaria TaxID=6604 RepID=UPI0022E2699F|nr:inner centromere protein B-like [Mya arenaria]XP_052766619.1 inner centromere protein B-like [Mya arenaria]
MGCGQSQVGPAVSEDKAPLDRPKQNGTTKTSNPSDSKQISSTDSNANRADSQTNNPVPRSVAFTLDLDGKETNNALLGPPPPRLKRLDPLNVPKLTANELAEKQRLADEKRESELKRKQSASLKASRRRRQILDAQKFDQQLQQKEKQEMIEESLESAGKSREAKLKDRQLKQQLREQRAQRARERVKKLNDLDQELDIEVEKDEDYNADEVDSWLDGDNNNNNNDSLHSADSDEKIYNGRSSPQKQIKSEKRGLNRGISANTIDSFDNAYNRKQPGASQNAEIKDDFFDT